MHKFTTASLITLICFCFSTAFAQEVDKGKIPEDQLSPSFKTLAWGSPVWDEEEAINALKKKGDYLWVDTRPESFFNKGTVRDAILLPYNKQTADDNEMTEETLAKALADAGKSKDTTTIIMFCQGPKCHRSYNATFVAVTEWGYSPDKMVWFRAGYPLLLKAVKGDPKLQRKAKYFISDQGLKTL